MVDENYIKKEHIKKESEDRDIQDIRNMIHQYRNVFDSESIYKYISFASDALTWAKCHDVQLTLSDAILYSVEFYSGQISRIENKFIYASLIADLFGKEKIVKRMIEDGASLTKIVNELNLTHATETIRYMIRKIKSSKSLSIYERGIYYNLVKLEKEFIKTGYYCDEYPLLKGYSDIELKKIPEIFPMFYLPSLKLMLKGEEKGILINPELNVK